MTKPLSPEYIELKNFFRTYMAHVLPPGALSLEQHPVTLLEAMEKSAPAKAFAELRVAVNDCIEESAHWPVERVAALDTEMRSQKIVTLSQIRQRYWSKYASVLKRGRIRSEVEYYLVQGLITDQALSLSESERQQLESMSTAYEQRGL